MQVTSGIDFGEWKTQLPLAIAVCISVAGLLPGSSYAVDIRIDHTNGCIGQETFLSVIPTSPTTSCSGTADLGFGTTLTETTTQNSIVGYQSFGAGANVTLEAVAPIGLSGGTIVQNSLRLTESLTISGGTGSGFLTVNADVHGAQNVPGSWSAVAFGSIGASNGGGTFASLLFNGAGLHSLEIPFVFGDVFSFERFFAVRIDANIAGTGLLGPISGSIDYLNTANYGFTVLDAQRQLLTGTSITSDNGFVYTQTPAIPEPGSYALMLAGLAFVGWSARRRPA